jgi:hypothetical protein
MGEGEGDHPGADTDAQGTADLVAALGALNRALRRASPGVTQGSWGATQGDVQCYQQGRDNIFAGRSLGLLTVHISDRDRVPLRSIETWRCANLG